MGRRFHIYFFIGCNNKLNNLVIIKKTRHGSFFDESQCILNNSKNKIHPDDNQHPVKNSQEEGCCFLIKPITLT